jgi:hypothetical protein
MTAPDGGSPAVEALVDVFGISPVEARRIVRAIFRAFLDSFCPIPDGLDTLEQWQRESHEDLAQRAPSQLLLERDQLELRLKMDQAPTPWLAERLQRVREAIGHAR